VPAAGIFLQMAMTSSLAVRSLFWTILLPGFFAGFLPWRYFGLRHVVPDWGSPRHLLGVAAIAIGVALLGACMLEVVRRGRGTPVDPPVLVVQGLYRYVRNPVYLSVTLIVLGEVLLVRSMPLRAYWAVWFVAVNVFVIRYEERAMRRRFGRAYLRYCATVGRWLPRRPTEKISGWNS
jgi:protein-S-isoprenylcysteine O-methyltransferase Ste14